MTRYKIRVWIPVDVEEKEDEIYASLEEAGKDKESVELMQPENRYEIEEVEE